MAVLLLHAFKGANLRLFNNRNQVRSVTQSCSKLVVFERRATGLDDNSA